ncbi:MAG TPA: glycoside hydrolase family 15 protein [Pirellulales bacterium]|jgi:GH15 family glucan-1,4-alpha-glucosidase|nr:glycoside hydrolase family 15 protein [Pirellulales bacterium]
MHIEDYALIGDCHTAALVGRDGSIDWLCLPRFDAGACFAALLGTPENGCWKMAPVANVRSTRRRYRPGTLILETDFETDEGAATIIDFMPPRAREPNLVRIVQGRRGRIAMRTELTIRFDYGSIVPWVRRTPTGIEAIAGPDSIYIDTDVELRGENLHTVGEFTVQEGQQQCFVLLWHPSNEKRSQPRDAKCCCDDTQKWWEDWTANFNYSGPHQDLVLRSLITLKALTYAPTGGIVAAPTTSLPEFIGGVRNWDYRFCWLRDATFTLYAFMQAGYTEEAADWCNWLLRAVAGSPAQMNIMYGLAGERRLTEIELKWLPGYEQSAPVRIGNAAWNQFQLDVFGEICDVLHVARRTGIKQEKNVWAVQRELGEYLETHWHDPDEGIWEVRGPRQHFVHSKVMAWVAFDRLVKAVERYHTEGPVDKWRQIRDEIHHEVCRHGFNPERNSFVQAYGNSELDASLLMMPLVGFLPPTDSRVQSTIAAIQRELTTDGFVARYRRNSTLGKLPPGQGVFLPCSFWLVDALNAMERRDEAIALFERLAKLTNDVGLISEEFDPAAKRFLGNFPQAFTHVALANSAFNLWKPSGPAKHRQEA